MICLLRSFTVSAKGTEIMASCSYDSFSWNPLSGKGAQEVSGSSSCSKQDELWDQARLLRAFCFWVLKITMDGGFFSSPMDDSHYPGDKTILLK